MNTKHLKAKILDLAIRGKLVPQDSSEGNAAELLQKIREERKAVVEALETTKQKKIKEDKNASFIIKADDGKHYEQFPDGSLKDIEDEIPFEIPENWCWCRLREITTLLGDGLHGSPKYEKNGDYYFINGNNLENGVIKFKSDTKKVSFDEFNKYKKNLNEYTVLVSINGTLGNVAFYNNEKIILGKSACYFNLISVDFKNFIYWLIKTEYFLNYANTEATGSTIKNVSLDAMRNFFIPLPPLSEQQRIVSAIEKAFEQIDIIEKNKLSLKTYIKQTKSKVLDLAIHGKLVEQNPQEGNAADLLKKIREEKHAVVEALETTRQKKLKEDKNASFIIKADDGKHYKQFADGSLKDVEDEIPFEIPANWCWCRLNTIATIERGGSPRPISHFLTKNKDGVNWIKIGDTKKGDKYIENVKEKIIPEGIRHSRLVHAGDFLLTNSMSFGRPYILKVDGCIHDGWLVFGNILPCITSDFLFQLLSSPFIYESFTLTAAGSTVKNLNIDRVKQVVFPLPPLSEQKRIVAKIEQVFEQLDVLEKSVGE